MSKYTKQNPSPKHKELIKAYKDLHNETSKFKGISVIPFAMDIYDIIKFNDCKSIFDYGCGKGIPYKDKYKEVDPKGKVPNFDKPLHKWWGIDELFLYDPAYSEHDKLPTKQYDLVLCTDVLEHVAEEDLHWTVQELCNFADKAVFINVSTELAKKTFKIGKYKGENVHISLFNHEWWKKMITNVWKDHKHLKIYLTSFSKKGIMGTCIKGE